MSEARIRPIAIRPAPGIAAIGLDVLMDRIYAARGVTTPEELDYALPGLLPVSSLSGVQDAVRLILKHEKGRIIIIGDFDADGATSTALVIRCLRQFGITNVDYLVPNRFQFGYGLTPEIVNVANERSPDLLITVDNGISSAAGVAEAHRHGMQVLITDHHLPGDELPGADVILNPNLVNNEFESGNLAGVGVAFYLMAALGRELELAGREGAAKVPARYLDLVALGTVADVVRLDRNNRILVEQGLKRIRVGKCVPGIKALFHQARRSTARAISSDLGFAAGPRLNAAGRLKDMSVGIECLLTDEEAVAARYAETLDGINRERRNIEAKMQAEAFDYVDAMDATRLPACICLYDEQWHQGIVGLIAARVRERFDRPVIAFARDGEGQLKGSARSVPGVHVRDLLEAVRTTEPDSMVRFGGHAMAAGLTLEPDRYDQFAALVSECLDNLYPEADFSGTIMTDGSLTSEALSLGFARQLREGGPWGAGFPEPVFAGEFNIVDQRVVGENHLKMRVKPTMGGNPIDAIAFNQAGSSYRGTVQLAYRLEVNEYRSIESPQLVVEQIVNI